VRQVGGQREEAGPPHLTARIDRVARDELGVVVDRVVGASAGPEPECALGKLLSGMRTEAGRRGDGTTDTYIKWGSRDVQAMLAIITMRRRTQAMEMEVGVSMDPREDCMKLRRHHACHASIISFTQAASSSPPGQRVT